MTNDWRGMSSGDNSGKTGRGGVAGNGGNTRWGAPKDLSKKPGSTAPRIFSGKTSSHAQQGSQAKTAWGQNGQPRPKGSFYGDLNGDGKETALDDFIGDGLLMDAMQALKRAERGEPPEPEDEFLIGPRNTTRFGPSSDSPLKRSSGVGAALVILGLAMGLCAVMASLLR